ncbi:MAG: type I-C CRISPR-associated protein Cas7/Csd2 [Coriobacteriia bacterium]|nr:type I-C CRISPR-associated protein Cas7/Csd2 [Coriobacteriia bacterium]
MSQYIGNRYDFVLFFDVENGNPNGDPDAGNMPRIDPETGIGVVSDVCLKRKIRNYVELVKSDGDANSSGSHRFNIYIQEKAVLNAKHEQAYIANDLEPKSKTLPKEIEDQIRVTKFMCDNFYDVRTFGAVMTTEINCGQVRGPVQMCFAQSVDPIIPQEMSITRMAVTNERDIDKERTMGRKQYVPYGLYRTEGFISANLAEKTGFDDDDLDLLLEALMNMFENDRSAARGLMTSRKLVLFKHESVLGNAPARALFDAVKASKVVEGPARHYEDYDITIDKAAVPESVEVKTFDWIQPGA